jgi:2'-5' RNA ligase
MVSSHPTELVVVAIPSNDDRVWKYSSEDVPHMTLLYLGDPKFTSAELAMVTGYIAHAASQLTRFMLEVDRRGELGDKGADVLFFQKRYAKAMINFRSHLLQNELISRAYHSIEQYPEWTPHLTMGYPDAPAKKSEEEYNRYSYVRFDRIALWTSDSDGPTFQLVEDDYNMEVAMSEADGAAALGKILHYGIKGMHWGVRKKSGPGSGKPASADSTRASTAKEVAKKSGVKALSNDDLQALVTRMNLEQQLDKLTPASKVQKGRKFATDLVAGVGKRQIDMLLNQAVNTQVSSVLRKANK